MRVSIFGLGYVGAVAAACIAEGGHEVITIDIDPVKVNCIKEGRSPIVEPGLPEMIKSNVEAGRLKATMSCEEAVMNSDISMICVGTPSHQDGSLNLDYVRATCAEIGAIIKNKAEFHSVVLRSTVVPGTARDIAIPALEAASGKKAGVGFGYGNNPEFLRESTAIYDYFNPPKVVVGASDQRTADAVLAIYENIDAAKVTCDIEVAEGVKYADNAWHAMKVGFANELGNILKELGVDSHKVMDIFFLDTKLNLSKAYLKPGFAFGGSCLPKDVRAIRASGKAKGIKTPIFDALLTANEEQVNRAHKMILSSGKKKVGLMGLSFKAGSDDLRESPLVTLAELLLKDGIELSVYDPCIFEASNMNGANQKYIREVIPHISSRLVEHASDFINGAEMFVIGNHGEDYASILSSANQNLEVIDLVRLKNYASGEKMPGYSGICW